MYQLKIKTITKELLKIKKFDTKQELDEFFYDHNINDKILIKDDWYIIRVKEKYDDLRTFYVSKPTK